MDLKSIECPLCGNKGFTIENNVVRKCVCLNKRNAMRRLEQSGLLKSVEKYTFESFETSEPWQQRMKEIAERYVNRGVKDGNWLYFGGQPGTGKTHLATASLGKLAESYDIRYSVWTIEVQQLKSVIMDAERYHELMISLQSVDVLFIDDLFKPGRDKNGGVQAATAADIRIAFDILNYRYINDLPTIISSEWYSRELDTVDEAVASRIFEKCGDYIVNIKRDIARNYRYRNDTII